MTTVLAPDTLFDSRDLNRDLARKSLRGGMTTMGSQGVQFVLRIASTMLRARVGAAV